MAPVLHSKGVVKLRLFLLIVFLIPWVALGASVETVFRNESELGYVLTSGNTDVASLSAKQHNRWEGSDNAFHFNARYLRSSNQGIEQSLFWSAGFKYERLFSSLISGYLGQLVESNIYQKINQRYASDAGVKLNFYKREKDLIWFAEAGYRFARENYPSNFQDLQFMRIYSEIENYWIESVSGKLNFEYLPNLTRWKGYQINSALSLSAALSVYFSLKTSYEFRFNNEPPAGTVSNSDRVLITAFVAKF